MMRTPPSVAWVCTCSTMRSSPSRRVGRRPIQAWRNSTTSWGLPGVWTAKIRGSAGRSKMMVNKVVSPTLLKPKRRTSTPDSPQAVDGSQQIRQTRQNHHNHNRNRAGLYGLRPAARQKICSPVIILSSFRDPLKDHTGIGRTTAVPFAGHVRRQFFATCAGGKDDDGAGFEIDPDLAVVHHPGELRGLSGQRPSPLATLLEIQIDVIFFGDGVHGAISAGEAGA